MGFWDLVGSAAKSAVNSLQESAEEIRELKAEMSLKSDRELADIVINQQNRGKLRASTAFGELKNRGYADLAEMKRIL